MEIAEQAMFNAVDPTRELEGRPIPAMTTMLYRVCDSDGDKFDEAMRLVTLIVNEALAIQERNKDADAK